jgi:hypothetical protein
VAFEDFWMSQTETPPSQIDYSLRFQGAQYLQRPVGSGAPTDGNKATLSMWVKRGQLSSNNNTLITAGSTASSTYNGIFYRSSTDDVRWVNQGGGSQFDSLTNNVYRDPSAWYNLVFVIDGNNAVASNRNIVYVNGVAQSLSAGPSGYGVTPAQSASNGVWWTTPSGTPADNNLNIGAFNSGTGVLGGYYFNGYIADVFLVDGQALPATTFGSYDANGVWGPAAFIGVKAAVIGAGGFGAKGFALNFDPANFNSGTLVWADQSGNGNNFTANWNAVTGASPNNSGSDLFKELREWSGKFNALAYSRIYTPSTGSPFTLDSITTDNITPVNTDNYVRASAKLLPQSGKYWVDCSANFGVTSGYQSYAYVYLGVVPKDSTYTFTAWPQNPQIFLSRSMGQFVGAFWGNGQINSVQAGTTYPNFPVTANIYPSPGRLVAFLDMDNRCGWVGIPGYDGTNLQFPAGQDPTNPATAALTWAAGEYVLQTAILGADLQGGTGQSVGAGFSGLSPTYAVTGYQPLSLVNYPAPSLGATITGSFTGNGSANGPYIYTGCCPGRIQYGTIDVTFGNRFGQSDVDFLADGFKVRSTTSNPSATAVPYTVTTTHTDGEFFTAAGGPIKVPYGGDGVTACPAITN